MILPKYIDGDSSSYLYEGETMALLELDAKENEALINELVSIEGSCRNLTQGTSELLSDNIKDFPLNSYTNQIEKTKILPLSVILPITSSCNLKCP